MIITLAEQAALIDAVADGARRLAVFATLALTIALLCFAALCCLVAALWIFAAQQLGPLYAPLVVAGALFLAAMILALVLAVRRRQERRAPSSAMKMMNTVAQQPGRLISVAAEGFVAGFRGPVARR